MRNMWKLAAWNSPPWEDEPEQQEVDGTLHGEIEEIELPEMPGVLFTVQYEVDYTYMCPSRHHEEEIRRGSPRVVSATYIHISNLNMTPISVGRKFFPMLEKYIDDETFDYMGQIRDDAVMECEDDD